MMTSCLISYPWKLENATEMNQAQHETHRGDIDQELSQAIQETYMRQGH